MLAIIDGNSLANRAYHAIKGMSTKKGFYTNAIYGFVNMLEKLKKDYDITHLVAAFDLKAPTFRHKMYSEYKGTRKKSDVELVMQFPVIKEILKAMNIPIFEMEGYEADDIIGTLACKAEKEGLQTLIVSGDKDILQLATEKTFVLLTVKGISQVTMYDRKVFVEQYGFEPKTFIDFKAIAGDTSDNIPGVKGVGEKKIIPYLKQYGSLENIYEHIDEITPVGAKTKLIEQKDNAFLSKELATICCEVPIDVNFDETKLQEVDVRELAKIYREYELNSFLKKLDIKEDGEKELKLNTYDIEKISDVDTFEAFIEKLQKLDKDDEIYVVQYFEENDKNRIVYTDDVAVLMNEQIYYIANLLKDELKLSKIAIILASNQIGIVGHDVKKILINLLPFAQQYNVVFDTIIARYLLETVKSDESIKHIADEMLLINIDEYGKTKARSALVPQEEQLSILNSNDRKVETEEIDEVYINNMLASLVEIRKLQQKGLEEKKLVEVFHDIELSLIEVMAYMQYIGFKLDKEYLKNVGEKLKQQADKLEKEIHDVAGEEFNIKSPKQLGAVLFEHMGLKPIKKTKTGYATNADVLEKLRNEHQIIGLILEYRKLEKLIGTYIDSLLEQTGNDSRIHAEFNQTIAATGRISSSNPNMQNIPVRTGTSMPIRAAFVPEDEYILIGADYSQIELRVLAHMSHDESMLEAFNNNEDIHRATASRVFGLQKEEITSLERSKAKAINFGIIYGMSAFGLSSEINISRKEAESYIEDYFLKHPKVKQFMEYEIEFCKSKGYVETLFGRRRIVKDINASNYMAREAAKRLAMNSPIQGTSADIIKIAMVDMYKKLQGKKSRLLLQVHDELIVEAHMSEVEEIKEMLVDTMMNACKLDVKLEVELNEGQNWSELK